MKSRLGMILIFGSTAAFGQGFNELWKSIPRVYKDFEHTSNYAYCHDFWLGKVREVRSLLFGPANRNFLSHPAISGTMVRDGIGPMQRYEIAYLNQLEPALSKKIKTYKDTDFVPLKWIVPDYNCSVSTLGHLYYFAVMRERTEKDPTLVLELGGGYGNLARIFTQLCPNCSYVIVDIPEILSIQWLYLTGSSSVEVTRCQQLPADLKPGVYLVPVGAVKDLRVKPDIFVSNFALSECHQDLQRDIADLSFFEADMVYLIGGLAGKWREDWVPHNYLVDRVKRIYQDVEYQGFQRNPLNTIHSYELWATKGVGEKA